MKNIPLIAIALLLTVLTLVSAPVIVRAGTNLDVSLFQATNGCPINTGVSCKLSNLSKSNNILALNDWRANLPLKSKLPGNAQIRLPQNTKAENGLIYQVKTSNYQTIGRLAMAKQDNSAWAKEMAELKYSAGIKNAEQNSNKSLKIENLQQQGDKIIMQGTATPNTKLKIYIY